jgi:hypothetical protein
MDRADFHSKEFRHFGNVQEVGEQRFGHQATNPKCV